MASKISRRKFLALAGAGSVGLGLAACNSNASAPMATPTPTIQSADEMDGAIEKAVRTFVANMDASGKTFFPRPATFKREGDTKIFELVCQEILWEVKFGERMPVFAFAEVLPMQEIRVTEGDKVRVIVRNQMRESTTLHWHGIRASNVMDGATYVSQPPIKPGAAFTYELIAQPVGSHLYRSHHNAAEQISKGLLGPFIVEPKDKKSEPAFDSDYTMVLNDMRVGLTINGRLFPLTAPIIAKPGERVRVRWMNGGLIAHSLHLHGLAMQVIAQDGWLLPNPYPTDTLNLAPGQRVDVIITATEPGVWAIDSLAHEPQRGANAMVTAITVR